MYCSGSFFGMGGEEEEEEEEVSLNERDCLFELGVETASS